MKTKFLLMTLLGVSLPARLSAQTTFAEMVYNAAKTVFRLNASTADIDATSGATTPSVRKRTVKIRIYNDGIGGKPLKTLKMKPAGDALWQATVKGDMKGKFYTFDTGNGESPGVFAKAVGVNGKRGAIIDMAETDPDGWADDVRPELKSPADLVLYEMHWRDFSIDASSRLVHKGKYLALTEPRAIDHLKQLGINAVHILPSFDYASVDETHLDRPQYNWGYDPVNYNVPDGGYSTDPYLPSVRIKEFKQMVAAMHKAGIRVILDVVYNHTFNIDDSNFQLTYPDYYYRKNADGTYSNGSGCGNETASEKPLMRRFMIESMKYWVQEYHIDGFRVDLMGVHDIETMNTIQRELQAIDPTLFIYGEGWSAGSCALPSDMLALKAHANRMPGIAVFSDDMRDALRGPFSDDTKGAFLAGISGEEESLKFGIVGGISHAGVDMQKVNYDKQPFALEPVQQISYVSCHDDMCLVDRLRAEMPGIGDEELIRLDLLAQTAVFTSQGIPFMLSGEEMLRSKKGVHNSYDASDDINHLDWDNLDRFPEVFNYYKNLIALRKAHPAFRLGSAAKVRQHLEFLPTDDCLVGFRLKDLKDIDAWKEIVVVFNANRTEKAVVLPMGDYNVALADATFLADGAKTVQGGSVSVAPQSALILYKK